MNKQTDRKNASFAYSANMLRTLMDMKLITEDEYRKILQISAEHYGAEKYMSELITFAIVAGCMRTHVVVLVLPGTCPVNTAGNTAERKKS